MVTTNWLIVCGPFNLPPAYKAELSPLPLPPVPMVKIVNEVETTLNAPELACNVYPKPILSMDNPLKLASPFTALTVVVPLKVPPSGLLAMPNEIALLAPKTGTPSTSTKLSCMVNACVGSNKLGG